MALQTPSVSTVPECTVNSKHCPLLITLCYWFLLFTQSVLEAPVVFYVNSTAIGS